MSRDEDTSTEHFDWLVDARSRNQKSTAGLYKIIESNARLLGEDFALQSLAQDLTAITFSLWRAVFLSDSTGELGYQLADVRRFLRSLIAHNTVLYQTDFTSREWAFRYYLQNAIFRLERIAETTEPSILEGLAPVTSLGSAKEDWIRAQQTLERAVTVFATAIDTHV